MEQYMPHVSDLDFLYTQEPFLGVFVFTKKIQVTSSMVSHGKALHSPGLAEPVRLVHGWTNF